MLSFWSTLFFSLSPIVCLLGFASPSVIISKADRDTVGSSENGREISRELFDSLEELTRIVDISYCVGTSGVWEPFQCLNRCDEFEGFELVTVRKEVENPIFTVAASSSSFNRVWLLTDNTCIVIKTWDTGPLLSDSCGYVALSHPPFPKRIIIAFRGTYSMANAIVDLSLYPQPYVPYTGEGNGEGNLRCSNCTVHAGFMTAWQNTRPAILPHLLTARKRHPDYNLVLVGHSLGGAVAALAGLEMQSRGWNPQVTTFGEPRIGNEEFVRYINSRFGLANSTSGYAEGNSSGMSHGQQLRFRRVTHVNDPVPLLPLEELDYKMHGGEIFISKLDLPPSVSDIELCYGNQDARCIAGAEALKSLGKSDSDLPVGTGDHIAVGNPMEQMALFNEKPTSSRISFDDDKYKRVGPQSPLNLLQPPAPSRFRVWELVFAHRDYFWRLGLCLPGGDPTRSRAYRASSD